LEWTTGDNCCASSILIGPNLKFKREKVEKPYWQAVSTRHASINKGGKVLAVEVPPPASKYVVPVKEEPSSQFCKNLGRGERIKRIKKLQAVEPLITLLKISAGRAKIGFQKRKQNSVKVQRGRVNSERAIHKRTELLWRKRRKKIRNFQKSKNEKRELPGRGIKEKHRE